MCACCRCTRFKLSYTINGIGPIDLSAVMANVNRNRPRFHRFAIS